MFASFPLELQNTRGKKLLKMKDSFVSRSMVGWFYCFLSVVKFYQNETQKEEPDHFSKKHQEKWRVQCVNVPIVGIHSMS